MHFTRTSSKFLTFLSTSCCCDTISKCFRRFSIQWSTDVRSLTFFQWTRFKIRRRTGKDRWVCIYFQQLITMYSAQHSFFYQSLLVGSEESRHENLFQLSSEEFRDDSNPQFPCFFFVSSLGKTNNVTFFGFGFDQACILEQL